MEIELEPSLASCIERVAKREYEQILREILHKSEGNTELQERLETLRLFLKSEDFGKLRSEYEKYLLAGKKVKFILWPTGGKSEYEIEIG